MIIVPILFSITKLSLTSQGHRTSWLPLTKPKFMLFTSYHCFKFDSTAFLEYIMANLSLLLFGHWVVSHSLWPHGLQQARHLSFTVSRSFLTFLCIELVMLSNHLILCHPLLLPSIFPSIRVFSIELALHMKWLTYKLLMTVKHCSKCLTCIITFLKLHNNLLK